MVGIIGFETFTNSLETLFLFSLGGISFDCFDNPESVHVIKKQFNKFFLGTFAIMITLILLNFIIALLSETYSDMKQYAKS